MDEKKQLEIFAKKLNFYIYLSGKQQKEIAEELGIKRTTFNSWCTGKILPRLGKLQMLADYFGIEKSDLVEEKTIDANRKSMGYRIPVFGVVAAGIPIEAIESVIDWEEIPDEMAHQGEFFGLKVRGDSMEPKISQGDVLIIRKQESADSGDLVIATVNGTDATCKRLKLVKGGLMLISNNPAYEPMFFTSEEVQTKPVQIIGKVVELRSKF